MLLKCARGLKWLTIALAIINIICYMNSWLDTRLEDVIVTLIGIVFYIWLEKALKKDIEKLNKEDI